MTRRRRSSRALEGSRQPSRCLLATHRAGVSFGESRPSTIGGEINYVHIDVLRFQSQLLQQIEERQGFVPCEGLEYSGPCGEPAEYMMPDATRPGGGESDIEIRPAWFCRAHLSELLGRDPGEQPVFRRIEGPEE
jgi:hypothetical protein